MDRSFVGLIATLILTFAPSRASAYVTGTRFSYDEHRRVSNEALRIALAAVEHRWPGDERMREVVLVLKPLIDTGTPSSTTYGDLVALVDVASSPIDFYTGVRNDGSISLGSPRGVPWVNARSLLRSRLQRFRSMHGNFDHFGARALFAYEFWHGDALRLAAGGDLSGAIVRNAFADHYLQDHFAPGHVWTPRLGLHDAIATGIHDYYNRRGARYYPRNLATLFTLAEEGGLTAWRGCDNQSVVDCLRSTADTGLAIWGDGQLQKGSEQETYMSLLFAQSLIEVIEGYLGVRHTSAIADGLGWTGYLFSDPEKSVGLSRLRGRWSSPQACTTFGAYDVEPGKGLPKFDRLPIVGLSMQILQVADRQQRYVVPIEMPAFWVVSDWVAAADRRRLKQSFQWGTLVGLDVASSAHSIGAGPRGRVVVAFTKIDAQASVDFGDRLYRGAGGTADAQNHAWHAGLRGEVGIYGFLSLGVGVESDRFMDWRSGTLRRRGVAISPSAALTLPLRHTRRVGPPPRALTPSADAGPGASAMACSPPNLPLR